MAIPLQPDFIEHIHDVLVGLFLPFDEIVNPSEYRNRDLIESAAGRPFHTSSGSDLLPSLPQKAAALFHSLACNHCFINGNKRTAVIALDLFLVINMHLLTMNSDEVYALAKETANANQEKRNHDEVMGDLAIRIGNACFDIEMLRVDPDLRKRLGEENFAKIFHHLQRMTDLGQRLSAIGMFRGDPADNPQT